MLECLLSLLMYTLNLGTVHPSTSQLPKITTRMYTFSLGTMQNNNFQKLQHICTHLVWVQHLSTYQHHTCIHVVCISSIF
jgi:hypothetical protein